MALRRKQRAAAPDKAHDYKIRLPEDVAERIEREAKAAHTPLNRVIINDLAAIPRLRSQDKLAEHVRDLEVIMARYAGRITMHALSEDLLKAVDAILAAEGGAQQAAIDRLRVARTVMLKTAKKQPIAD